MTLSAVLPQPPSPPTPLIGAAFERVGVSMTFAPDDEIYAQDEDTDLVYLILSGAVRTVRLLADGRRQVSAFYYAGDMFGLETRQGYQSSAEALSQTKVLVVKRSALRHYGEAGERLERALWRATGEELARVHDHMVLLARKSALERVAGFLDDVARRLGGERVVLPMSRQDMADYLGLTIETVSRMVTQLQLDRVVQFEGSRRFRVSAPGRLALLVAA